ncbi:MAG: hypothetical protein LBG90_04015 [Spirochaetaceae bacterium]|jgi:hypothetical protein|nr:hypothetical protein [Spirochaetaceae bacterium]
MAHNDWIPGREQDLIDLIQKWGTVLADSGKAGAFAWDSGEVTEVLGKINGFLAARRAYEGDNSTAKRLAKDEAKEEAVDAMRDFANASIRFNKKMDDPAKLLLGIRLKDSTPTAHAPPASQPETAVENTLNHFEHRVKALNHEGQASKPGDAYGVRFAWQVGREKPLSGGDLPKTKFSRKTTHVVTHTEADKGKPAYYATCYENSKGENGPWSPIEEAFIG